MTAPCKGCQLREPGCHGKCEAYREYRAWKDEEAAYKAQVDIFEAAELPKPEQIGIEEGEA